MRVSHFVLFSTLALSPLALADDDGLTSDKVGKIQYDEQKADEQVDAKYGNKKMSEMDSAERSQYFQDKRAAERETHEKNGVADRDLAIYKARMGPDAKKAADAASRAEEKKNLKKELKDEEKDDGPKVVAYEGSEGKRAGAAAAAPSPKTVTVPPPGRSASTPSRPSRGAPASSSAKRRSYAE